MNRHNWPIRPVALGLGSLALLASAAAFGDSLLLKDGRLISGPVRRVDSGYIIRTKTGEQKFSDDEVEHWTHSESADSDTPAAHGAAPAAPATPGHSATSPGAAAKAKNSQQKSVAVLVARGNNALAAGDYKAARDSFADALLLEPKNAAASEGAGYAYMRLDPPNYVKARDALEIAYAALQPPPRSLACDLSLALVKTHNPMRSAKVLKEYLTAHPTPLDEPALNGLAAALFQADEQTRHNAFFAQVGQFYEDYNKKLEATRPGEKRWGMRWLSAAEADLKLKTYFDKQSKIETLTKRLAADQAAYSSLSNDADVEANTAHPGAAARIAALKKQMAAAQADFAAHEPELARAKEGFEAPPVDETLAVVEPEAATAIASAAPLSTEKPTLAGVADLTGAKPASDDTVLPGRLFGNDSAPATPAPVHAAAADSPTVIVARPVDTDAPKRKLSVESNAVAFPVGPDLVVTTADAVTDATYITLQIPAADTMTAEVVAKDDASGLALLRVAGKRMAYLPLADAFLPGSVTCISFPDVNLFDPVAAAITGTIGTAPAAPGKFSVNLSRSPRLGGGPLLASGKIVGVQLANRDSDQHAIAVATLDDIKKLLATVGQPPSAPAGFDPKAITMQLTAMKQKG